MVSRLDAKKEPFLFKVDNRGNIVAIRASGPSGGQIQGSITTTNEGRSFIIAGEGIRVTSGTGGQILIAVDTGGGTTLFRVADQDDGNINRGYTTSSVSFSGHNASSIISNDIGRDVFFYVSGTIGSRNTNNSGSVVFGGDGIVSGTFTAIQGFTGSLTKLHNGSDYLAAGVWILITT